MQAKIKNAIKFITDGQYYTIDNLRLGFNHDGCFEVLGWSHNLAFENLNKKQSLQELMLMKELFLAMIESAYELEEIVANREIVYVLSYDDAGKGSIIICSDKNGSVRWHIEG